VRVAPGTPRGEPIPSSGLWIECTRPGCRQLRQVRNRHEQKTRRFCSKRCAAIVRCNVQRGSHVESGRRGGLASGVRRRAALLQKLATLSPLAAYKLGRSEGWHAGVRSVRRRLKPTSAFVASTIQSLS
jgi:hypothetical protein